MPNPPKHFKRVRSRFTIKPRQSVTVRDREVRDLYNKLRKTYVSDRVDEFFAMNYFMSKSAVEQALRRCDRKEVDLDTASIQYLTAIKEDFKL